MVCALNQVEIQCLRISSHALDRLEIGEDNSE